MALPKYWTEEDKMLVDQATSMTELSLIALAIIERMPQPLVQVFGPMTTGGCGSFKDNIARFQKAIDFLESKGFAVFNQLPFQTAMIKISESRKTADYDWSILFDFYQHILLLKKKMRSISPWHL